MKAGTLAALVVASLLALASNSLAADEASPEDLAARAKAILDERSPDFDKAREAIEQSLAKHPHFSPALLQQARLVLMQGGESPESLKEAELLLQSARNNDFNYGPTYPLQGYVYMKLNRPGDATMAFNRASRLIPNDPDFLYYNALYLASGYGDPFPVYERFLAAEGASKSRRFDVAHELWRHYLSTGSREKADVAFAEMIRIEPNVAELYGDYSRGVMLFYGDFDAGEKYARKAIAIKDYPHARQSLSLALYGKWAAAKAVNKDVGAVKALYDAAKANDPDGRLIPECSLGAPGLVKLRDSLEKARAPAAAGASVSC